MIYMATRRRKRAIQVMFKSTPAPGVLKFTILVGHSLVIIKLLYKFRTKFVLSLSGSREEEILQVYTFNPKIYF